MGDASMKRLTKQLASQHTGIIEAVSRLEGTIRHLERDANVKGLVDAAHIYERDAQRERATMWRLRVGVLGLLAIATGFLAIAANDAVAGAQSDRTDVDRFLLLASLSLPALFAAAYLSRQASLHRKAAGEIQRQRNQLLTLDPYLDPLPEHARLLYRALFARRFFPRSTDELDAMEDEEFPRPSMILTAVDPETFESG